MLYSEKVEVKIDTGSMDGTAKSTVNTDVPTNVLLHARQYAHIKQPQFLYANVKKKSVWYLCNYTTEG
jgi:hypothetical protein